MEMAKFVVLTYSKNGATFPNDGIGSPFCKPNEIIRNEGCKKPLPDPRRRSEKSGSRKARSRGSTRRSLKSQARGGNKIRRRCFDSEIISSTIRLVASEAIALPTTSVLRLNSTPLPAHRRCINFNLRKVSHPGNDSATSSYRRFVQKGNVKAYSSVALLKPYFLIPCLVSFFV